MKLRAKCTLLFGGASLAIVALQAWNAEAQPSTESQARQCSYYNETCVSPETLGRALGPNLRFFGFR
jgi:hypothetical protein